MTAIFNVWRVNGLHEPLPVPAQYTPEQASGVERIWPFFEDELEKDPYALSQKSKRQRAPYPQKEVDLKIAQPKLTLACQIMTTKVQCLELDTPLPECWSFFCEHRFRHVPVIDKDKKIAGIISDRDVMKEALRYFKSKKSQTQTHELPLLKNFMKPEVVTAKMDTPVAHIAHLFISHRMGAMPICTDLGQLEGIITRSDILRLVVKKNL